MLSGGPELVAVTAERPEAERYFGKIGTPRRGLTDVISQSNVPSRVRTGIVTQSFLKAPATLTVKTGILWPVGLANKSGTEAGFMCRPSTCYPAAKN